MIASRSNIKHKDGPCEKLELQFLTRRYVPRIKVKT